MKKIVALILAMALCLSLLAACGGGNTDETTAPKLDLSGTYDVTL